MPRGNDQTKFLLTKVSDDSKSDTLPLVRTQEFKDSLEKLIEKAGVRNNVTQDSEFKEAVLSLETAVLSYIKSEGAVSYTHIRHSFDNYYFGLTGKHVNESQFANIRTSKLFSALEKTQVNQAINKNNDSTTNITDTAPKRRTYSNILLHNALSPLWYFSGNIESACEYAQDRFSGTENGSGNYKFHLNSKNIRLIDKDEFNLLKRSIIDGKLYSIHEAEVLVKDSLQYMEGNKVIGALTRQAVDYLSRISQTESGSRPITPGQIFLAVQKVIEQPPEADFSSERFRDYTKQTVGRSRPASENRYGLRTNRPKL